MQNLETKLIKNDNGWKATTDIELGEVPANEYEKAGKRVLRITTSKHSFNKMVSAQASCHTSRPSVNGNYWTETHAMGLGSGLGDYSQYIIKEAVLRCTEKVIKEMHAKALEHVETAIANAKAHYAKQAGVTC